MKRLIKALARCVGPLDLFGLIKKELETGYERIQEDPCVFENVLFCLSCCILEEHDPAILEQMRLSLMPIFDIQTEHVAIRRASLDIIFNLCERMMVNTGEDVIGKFFGYIIDGFNDPLVFEIATQAWIRLLDLNRSFFNARFDTVVSQVEQVV